MCEMLKDGPEPQIYIVDDDKSILSAFSRLLRSAGFNVLTFESSRDFLAAHDPDMPGCALLDIRMKDMDGLALQTALASGENPRPIIFITGCDDARTSVRAMKAGAVDYLTKPVDENDLIAAVESALSTDRQLRAEREERASLRARFDRLTPREREVMARVINGRLNKQIADELGIVEKTIKVHRARVMEKMEVRSVAALVQLAQRLASDNVRNRSA